MGILSILGSLNKGTFDKHMSTRTVAFSLLICLGNAKFVFLGIFTLTYRHNLPDYVCKKSTLALDKHCLKCPWLSSLLLGEGVDG